MIKLTTNHGTITLELDTVNAPKTSANFIAYVESGHYDGTIFHRVIKNFMIQGGGMTPDMEQKPTQAPIENEGEQTAKAGLKNVRGSIAMARTNDSTRRPPSSSSTPSTTTFSTSRRRPARVGVTAFSAR